MTKKLLCIAVLVLMLATVFISCGNDTTHTHAFGEWETIREVNCTEDGINERYCSCGNKEEQIIPSGHKFESWVYEKDTTCTEDGLKLRKCSVCGDIERKTISAQGHNWLEATCTEAKKCSACNAKIGNPLGHDYKSTTTKEATCTSDGEIVYKCSRCQDSYSETVAGSHNFVDGVCQKCNKFDEYTGCAIVAVKSYFQQTLKNPSSLQLLSIEYYIGLTDKNYFRLEITYSAMNGFGGYNRDYATIYIRMNGDGTFKFSPYSSSDAATSSYSSSAIKYSSTQAFTIYYPS